MEQSYKEKYEQAIEKLRNFYRDYDIVSCLIDVKEELANLFPELAESEDEKIRKELIDAVQGLWDNDALPMPLSVKRKDKWLAWLGKQAEQKASCTSIVETGNGGINALVTRELPTNGEQKPTVKVEPKFKVRDWVVFNNKHQSTYQVEKIEDGYYILRHTHGGTFRVCVLHDESLRLWDITKDAKDGDVLAVDWKDEWEWQKIVIFKSLSENGVEGYGNTFKNNKLAFKEDVPFYSKTWTKYLHPATKEQRDLLFQKMKEAGYEWDADTKELKKIEQKLVENAKPQSSTPMSYGKELEKRMCEACNRFFAPNTDSNRYSASDLFYAGVKAERDLNTLAWSEEDEPQKELAASYLAKFDEKFPILPTLKGKQLADYKNFLNKCQQIFRLKYWGIRPTQAKLFEKLSLVWAAWGAEHLQGLGQTDGDMDNEISMWSEEDEKMLDSICISINDESIAQGLRSRGDSYSIEDLTTICSKQINWLKSLRPQNKWKPSDEQIGCLSDAIEHYNSLGYPAPKLKELYKDLKELKEE